MGAEGFEQAARKLERMGNDIEDNASNAVRRKSNEIAAQMKENIINHDAVATTELFRGITVLTGEGASAGSIFHAVIESSAPHSGFVEFGTGAYHRPNSYTRRYTAPDLSGRLVAQLTEWATLKPSLHVADPASFAWAVAHKISGNTEEPGGTKPQPFFVPAWEAHEDRVVRRVGYAVERAASF